MMPYIEIAAVIFIVIVIVIVPSPVRFDIDSNITSLWI